MTTLSSSTTLTEEANGNTGIKIKGLCRTRRIVFSSWDLVALRDAPCCPAQLSEMPLLLQRKMPSLCITSTSVHNAARYLNLWKHLQGEAKRPSQAYKKLQGNGWLTKLKIRYRFTQSLADLTKERPTAKKRCENSVTKVKAFSTEGLVSSL